MVTMLTDAGDGPSMIIFGEACAPREDTARKGMHEPHDESTPAQAPRPFSALAEEQVAMLEWSPHPKLVLDHEFRIRYGNRAALDYGQVEQDALVGRFVWECYPALKDSSFHQACESVLSTGVTSRVERYDDEHDRWQSIYAFQADGGVIAVLEDITERRRVKRALQASEAALARAQDVAGIGSFTVERPGQVQLSVQGYRLLGLDPTVDTVDIPTLRAMVAPSDSEHWRSLSSRTPIGDDIAMDFTVTRRDGRLIILHVLARVIQGSGGVVTLFGTAQDVTEQRLALEHLKRREETLRLAQEAANIGSFDADLRTGTMFRSDQLLRMLGLEPTDEARALVDSRPRFDFVHPDDRAAVEASWAKVLSTGERQIIRMRVLRADGVERCMMSSAILVRDGNGDPARIVGTQIDITDQVRSEEERAGVEAQLQQAQKLESLGVLAGGIAHDFNNLLVGILGNASLALLDLEPGAEARQSIAEIEQSAQRAAELTRQLLAYAGKGRYVVESADASTVITELTPLMRTAISRNASLQMELTTALPRIEVDVNQFRQVVMNLITNASDALDSKPGLISVRTGRRDVSLEYLTGCAPGSAAQPGPFTYVEVHDNGTGMDEATRQRIFEPFFSTKFTGRGLGLAATIGIMRSHHGAICVDSEVGSGTSITLLFPCSTKGSRAGARAGARTEESRSGGQILVVDDEDSVRAVASALLRRRGFRTQEASDGAKALGLFEQQPDAYDLVLLDLTMPGMNGEETLRALRDVRPTVNVLLMSGYNEQEVTEMFEGRSLPGFLQKPFRADKLYASVARSLGVDTNGR